MSYVMHIAAEAEPLELHGLDGIDVLDVYGAHLAIEALGNDEAAAKVLVEALLDRLPLGSFALCEIDVDTATLVAPLERVFPAEGNAAYVKAWLGDCQTIFAGLATKEDDGEKPTPPFYATPPRAIADVRNATAVDLLRSTAKWPAPLAQEAGLTTAVKNSFERDVEKFYAIVFLPEGVAWADVAVSVLDFDKDAKLARLEITLPSGETVELLSALVDDYEAPGNLFEPSGLFEAPGDAEALARFAERIEEAAPSLTGLSGVVLSLAANAEMMADLGVEPMQLLSWIGRAATAALFDVPVVALSLPEPDEEGRDVIRHSSVLQRLPRIIAGAFEDKDQLLDVDESRFYSNLHRELAKELAGITPPDLWTQISAIVPDAVRLERVGMALRGETFDVSWKTWDETVRALAAEISDLATYLESETGAEAWLLARCDTAFTTDGVFNTGLVADTGVPADTDQLTQLYQAFRRDILDEFNASEAMRRDFGALVVAALIGAGSIEDTVEIRRRLTAADWFNRRIEGADGSEVFDEFAKFCIDIVARPAPALESELRTAYETRAAEILAPVTAGGNFRPDPAPRPIALRIANDPDPAKVETAAAKISGLGFIVRAAKADLVGVDETAHVSLIALTHRRDANVVLADPTVSPVLPALNGGSGGLFLQYTGAPLATPNRPATIRGGGDLDPMQAAQARAAEAVRGYLVEDASYVSLNKTPALAYGRAYGARGFWMPNSGVLPVGVRASVSDPFTPGAPKAPFVVPDNLLRPLPRRTSISEMQTTDADFRTPRGVFPLATDAPRLALGSFPNGRLWIDIYRRADGAGVLGAEDVAVVLHDVAVSAGFDVTHLDIRQMTAPDQMGLAAGLALNEDGTLTITLPAPADDPTSWLRLSFEAGAPDGLVFSFGDPAHDKGQDSADRTAPVALLAPNTVNWTIVDQKAFYIHAPGVSYADFEYWARNSDLLAAIGTAPAKLFRALRFAQGLFEEIGDDAYADKMNRLPDPAVRGFLVTAAISDGVVGNIAPRSVYEFIRIAPYDIPAGDVPDIAAAGSGEERVETLRALVERILGNAKQQIALRTGAFTLAGGVLKVPEGHVARLLVRPAVPKTAFAAAADGGAFDPGMRELAVGETADHILFDGLRFMVEVMATVTEPKLPPEILQPVATGTQRGYALELRPDLRHRLYAQAQVVTQRWRPSGRPIYSWIDPVPRGMTADRPVVPIRPDGESGAVGTVSRTELESFEAEAFYDLGPNDADHRPVIRIQPAPEPTRLEDISWPARSATYHRHRLLLLSRYKGAMKTGGEADTGDWASRIAILAEPASIDLSRPQVRAFLPILSKVEGDKESPTAPIACVLSEPPFEQLGLADRLNAAIATINTYWFPPNDSLRVDDLRKEIGPDPRLSYFPLADVLSRQAILTTEGPVGLHFDAEGATAPAYSNSQWMLHLELDPKDNALKAELEESFAGVSITRHADPAWSWVPPDLVPDNEIEPQFPRDLDIWIDTTTDLTLGVATVEITWTGRDWAVNIARHALFEDGGTGPTELCRIAGAAPSLLVKALGDNRYQVAVFRAAPEGAVGGTEGRIGRPQLVATALIKTDKPLIMPKDVPMIATRQSEATFVEWVRTARDMSHLIKIAAIGDYEPVQISNLRPTAESAGGRRMLRMKSDGNAPISVASPVSTRRYPLHVHRHFAMFLRRPSYEIGHQIQLFDQAVLADGHGMAQVTPKADATVILGEIETRAEILLVRNQAAGLSAVELERYLTAHFDLLGSGASKMTSLFRYQFRAANRALNLQGLKLSFLKEKRGEEDETLAVADLGFAISTEVRTFEFFIYRRSDALKWAIRWHEGGNRKVKEDQDFAAGESLGAALENLGTTLPDKLEALRLIAATHIMGDETWLDVSLLHSTKRYASGTTDHFDFDWLFGSKALDDKLPQAVAPLTLNNLVEAQARLVGLSVPLTVQ